MATLPQRIGPYTLEKRLGAGGMGEVFQAYDHRLDRRVAVKLIRSEHTEKPVARERFRREARAAAALSHPSIVQIHDIVETGESDAIVMELIEGEALARRIARGPLPVSEAVRIGREIAEGLAAAHAKGLIHRDLKPENVMITAEGRAKILDFGLAKRLEGEVSLTEDHRVLGTFRSMSPEQAQGLPLDARSDLFSFGLLLYEMLSGRSPFEGSSTLETLTRLCTHRQTPLRELGAGIPVGLSDLVDRLLEKEPARRPESPREVASTLAKFETGNTEAVATLRDAAMPQTAVLSSSRSYTIAPPVLRWAIVALLLAVLAVALLWRQARPGVAPGRKPAAPAVSGPATYVAVPKPEMGPGTDREAVVLLATGLRESLLRGLLSLEGVRALSPGEVDAVKGGPREIARATAGDEVLSARLDCPAEVCQISLSRAAGEDGRLLRTESFSLAIDQLPLVPAVVQGYLRKLYAERRIVAGWNGAEASPEDYAEYLRLRRAYDLRQKGFSPGTLFARLAALRRTSPRFVEAYQFESEVREARYTESRDPEELDRGTAVLEEARRLVPEDTRPLLGEFGLALRARRFDQAESSLRQLEALLPGDPGILVARGRLLSAMGKPEKSVTLFETAVRRHPSWRNLFFLADAQYRLGRFAAARNQLNRLLARYPEHYDAESKLAQIELLHGSVERALELYRGLVRRNPEMTELSNLGFAQLVLGRYGEAEESFRRALAGAPRNAGIQLNLADALLLEGKRVEAEATYRRLLAGTRQPSADVEVLSARAQALAHLKQGPAAVAEVQEILHLAPVTAQSSYEISLVYLLLGDRNAALYNATEALRQGVEPRSFDLPWFDPLRTDQSFRSLLEQRRSETSL
ncbi:MAG TPA: protein kinase [Thermoanaerobaculia bacterium]|nr:protein kinase [Thermoanaerobaculia bacterium]